MRARQELLGLFSCAAKLSGHTVRLTACIERSKALRLCESISLQIYHEV